MSYKHTIYKGTPNLEAYAEKGRLEERDYQDVLALKKNEQALSLRQIMNTERATKQAEELALRRQAAEEKAAELKERMAALDMMAKQQEMQAFETPAQRREAESEIRKGEAKFSTEEGLRGRKLLRDYTMTTPEGQAAVDKSLAEAFSAQQEAQLAGRSLTAKDLQGHYDTLRKYENDINLAIEAKDVNGAAQLEAQKNKYIDEFEAMRSTSIPKGATFEDYKKGVAQKTQLAQDTPRAFIESLGSLSSAEQNIVNSVTSTSNANIEFNKAMSPKLRKAIAQKVAVYEKYLEDAQTDLINAKDRFNLVKSVVDKKHPRYREAEREVETAEDRVKQIKESSLGVVEKLVRREAGVESVELLATTSAIEAARARELDEREYAKRLRETAASMFEKDFLTGKVLPRREPEPPLLDKDIDWLTGLPRRK